MSELVPLTAWAVGGMAGARILPQMIAPTYNTGYLGYGLNIAATLGLSWLGGKFAGTRAAQGLLVGGFVGTAARILADWLGASNPIGGALSGDLDFDMGFYIPNSFPLPTTGSGPFLLQPGMTGSPSYSGGIAAALPAAVAAQTASSPQGSAANPTAAQINDSMSAHSTPRAWSTPWAA
jgi:hypothetical protein